MKAYEAASGGRIGLYAENLRTGATFKWRADERFVMCSTFKASLAACALQRIDRGADSLLAQVSYGPADLLEYAPTARENLSKGALSVADLCRAAVELSDNTCANLLLARIGGPPALTAFWRSLGDSVSRLDHNEPALNRSQPGNPQDTTTPAAMAGDLKRLVLGDVLSAPSRGRLTQWMVGCKTGANRLRAGLPKTWTIGDKTGNNGKDAAGRPGRCMVQRLHSHHDLRLHTRRNPNTDAPGSDVRGHRSGGRTALNPSAARVLCVDPSVAVPQGA